MADEAETPIMEGSGDSEQTNQQLSDIAPMVRREKGIDVSRWQGTVDWSKVAEAGVKHAFVKMSEGASYADKKFVENWNGASKARIKVNCYHYFRALCCTPKQQFDNIKKNTEDVGFDPSRNFLAIDVEVAGNEKATPSQMADNLNALLELIKEDSVLSRNATMIYTSVRCWNSKVKFEKYNFSAYPLWVAHWGAQTPELPASWKNTGKSWSWWQYCATGKVSGIAGDVDLNWVKVCMPAPENSNPLL